MTEIIEVRHVFTPDELEEKKRQLLAEIREITTLETQKTNTVADINAELKRRRTNMINLSEKLEVGYEYRDVQCEAILDEPEQGMKRMVDLLTGETVRELPMTEQDRQRLLFEKEEQKS